MPRASTNTGALIPISDCYIIIPYTQRPTIEDQNGQNSPIPSSPTLELQDNNIKIILDNLPEISDTKSASYSDETVIGRSSPIKTFSQSDNRSITMALHFIVSKPTDIQENIIKLRAIQSAVYPREGEGSGGNRSPFIPPPVCRIKCGRLLSDRELCVILKSYSVKFPTEIAWAEGSFTPMKFDVDTQWDVVYASSDLPGQERIFTLGA